MKRECDYCGAAMKAEHGIIDYSNQTGVTWWKCPKCGYKEKQEYMITDRIETINTSGVIEPW